MSKGLLNLSLLAGTRTLLPCAPSKTTTTVRCLSSTGLPRAARTPIKIAIRKIACAAAGTLFASLSGTLLLIRIKALTRVDNIIYALIAVLIGELSIYTGRTGHKCQS